jgi:hypothetical protein
MMRLEANLNKQGELGMNRTTLLLLGTVATFLAGISIGAHAQRTAEETAVRVGKS